MLVDGLVLILVGGLLYPIVQSYAATAAGTNVSTPGYALWGIVPIFYVLIIFGAEVALLYRAFVA